MKRLEFAAEQVKGAENMVHFLVERFGSNDFDHFAVLRTDPRIDTPADLAEVRRLREVVAEALREAEKRCRKLAQAYERLAR